MGLDPWKGQGTTNTGYCVMNPGDSEPSPGTCYVMISRVTSLKKLYIPNGITYERLTSKIRGHKGLASRVAEELRLQALQNRTIDFYNSNTQLF